MFIFSVREGLCEDWPRALKSPATPLIMTQDILRLINSRALNSPKAQVDVFIYLGTHFLPHSKQSTSPLQTQSICWNK